MTIDEAIQHCDEKSDCSECGKEHKQLAHWLRELRLLRKRLEPNSKICMADEDCVTCVTCGSDVNVTDEDFCFCPYCGQRLIG